MKRILNYNNFINEKIQDEYFEENPDFYLSNVPEKTTEETPIIDEDDENYKLMMKNLKIKDIKVSYSDTSRCYVVKYNGFSTRVYNHVDGYAMEYRDTTTIYDYKLYCALIEHMGDITLMNVSKKEVNQIIKNINGYYSVYYSNREGDFLYVTKDKNKFSTQIKELKSDHNNKITYVNNKVAGKELIEYDEMSLSRLRNGIKKIKYTDIIITESEDETYHDKYFGFKFKNNTLNKLLGIIDFKNDQFFEFERVKYSKKVYFGHLRNRVHVANGLPNELQGIGFGYKLYKALIKYCGYIISDSQTSASARKVYYNLLKDDDILHIIDRTNKGKDKYSDDSEKVMLIWKDGKNVDKLVNIVKNTETKLGRIYKYDKEIKQ